MIRVTVQVIADGKPPDMIGEVTIENVTPSLPPEGRHRYDVTLFDATSNDPVLVSDFTHLRRLGWLNCVRLAFQRLESYQAHAERRTSPWDSF